MRASRITVALLVVGLVAAAGVTRAAPAGTTYTFTAKLFTDPEQFPGGVMFTVNTRIPASLAERMIGNPEIFIAIVSTASGPAASGPLHGAGTLRFMR